MYRMSWLTTKYPKEMPQGKVNKLKGMAMEAAIQELMDKVEGSEDSLGNLLEQAEEHLNEVYNVKKMFKIWDGVDQLTFRRQVSDIDRDFKLALDVDELKGDKLTIKVSPDSNKAFLGYRRCGNDDCNFIYPTRFCRRCGGAVFDDRYYILKKIKEFNQEQKPSSNLSNAITGRSEEDLTKGTNRNEKKHNFKQKIRNIKKCDWNAENKYGYNDFCKCDFPKKEDHYFSNYDKCRKCHSGNYHKMKTEFSSGNWRVAEEDLSIDESIAYLKEKGFISESSFKDRIKGKRVDTWRWDGENVEIFESKNKEKTGLGYGNIAQVFYYIKALRKAGLDASGNARIIYNGNFPDSLTKSLIYFQSEYGYTIDAISLKEWCVEKEIFLESIEIGKDVKGKTFTESGEYSVNISFSESMVENPEIIIQSEVCSQ